MLTAEVLGSKPRKGIRVWAFEFGARAPEKGLYGLLCSRRAPGGLPVSFEVARVEYKSKIEVTSAEIKLHR